MAGDDTATTPIDISALTAQILAEVSKYVSLDKVSDAAVGTMLKHVVSIGGLLKEILQEIAQDGGKVLVAAEEPILPIFAAFIEPIIANMFGSEMPAGAFSSRGNRAARGEGARSLVNAYMDAIADANRRRPRAQRRRREAHRRRRRARDARGMVQRLDSRDARRLRADRMDALQGPHRAVRGNYPLARRRSVGASRGRLRSVDVAAATPMRWKVNKQYRPTLLSPAQAIRQAYRGNWDWADVQEICEREGYSDAAISALINEQRKFQSVADVRQLVTRGEWTSDRGLQHLRDQGYDEDSATLALRIEGLRRIEQHEASIASAALSAFVARDIDDATFDGVLKTSIGPPAERALLSELGRIRRELNVKQLSSGDVRAAVKVGILAVADYRGWLERQGYADDDVLTLELLLRAEMDEDFKADQARAEALEQRAAAQAAKDDAARKRRADVDAERALHARGSIGDLSRAVVRGLIPIARLEEVLTAQYDADTVGILVGLAEADRQVYLANQAKADAARQTAARRRIDVGALEQAVYEGVVPIDRFRAQLDALNFDPADADILTATLAAKLADRQAAEAARREADVRAAAKQIDLGRFEQLVRRGVRTLAEYAALLQALGFDDAARAAMGELLELKIADDRAAEQARRDAAARDAAKGLTLEQLRRGVVLGLASSADYERFLVTNGFTADAIAVLMGELRDDVTQAEAARRRRDEAEADRGNRALPLSILARAARLGVVPIDVYRQRLTDDGYSPDDVAIEMDLLTAEIADAQAVRAQQAAADAAPASPGLSLAQLERGVKAGTTSLEAYSARAIALGLDLDAVRTLTRIVGDELLASQSARARRAELASTLEAKNLALGPLEDQVKRGELTRDAYRATLVGAGVAIDDAELLASLLADATEGA
jgi:hypothetical protein